MTPVESGADPALAARIGQARQELDAHTVEMMAWHFHESTGCPVLAGTEAVAEVRSAEGDQELRRPEEVRAVSGRMAARRAGAALGAQGLCRQADLRLRDRRHDGHPQEPHRASTTSAPTTRCSATRCPTSTFPPGSNWLMLGPSGPRRLRLAVEHLAQVRGGICFCIDLDPRWVIKLIKKGWMEHLEAYKEHCIDQALTILGAGHDIRCMFTTPKLLEALATALGKAGELDPRGGHHRHLFRRHRVHAAVDPLRHGRAARRRLHDADLRQHADGPGLLQAGDDGRTVTRSATTPRSRGP